MKRRFQAGDLVRCVDVGTQRGLLEADRVYRVAETKPPRLVKLAGVEGAYFSEDHFKREVTS